MSSFYILNDVPNIQADTAKAAAKQYALAKGISAGKVKVATNIKEFDIVGLPADVQVTDV